MHPHHPEIQDARPPAAAEVFDESAISGINGQRGRLEDRVRQLGGVVDATIHVEGAQLPGHNPNTIHLNGHYFTLADGTEVAMPVDATVDPDTGVLVGEDAELVRARHRLAVLESREQNRGSRRGNWAYNIDRQPPNQGPRYRLGRAVGRVLRLFRADPAPEGNQRPADFGYGRISAKNRYRQLLAASLGRKIHANPDLNTPELISEAMGAAMDQEQHQMSALQRMAAEEKNSTRALNLLRQNWMGRIAVGVAMGAGGGLLAASGLWVAAVPMFAFRTGLGAAGGYLSGRTLWDGVQGRRAQRLPIDDIRSTRVHDHNEHFYVENAVDYLHPQNPAEEEGAARAYVKMLYAESRAGIHDERRRRLTARLGQDVVRHYYQTETENQFAANGNNINQADIEARVIELHENITAVQEERLASDQTQSRARHRAGLIGALVFGLAPFLRGVGGVGVDYSWGGGGSSHHAGATLGRAARGGAHHHISPGGRGGSHPHTAHSPANAGQGDSSRRPEIINNYYFNGDHDTFNLGSPSGSLQAGSGHHLPSAIGVKESTSILHVEQGGGFIDTFEDQYHLNPAQADSVYEHMYHQLYGAHGTYLVGSDIRISEPGNFKLNSAASRDLSDQLRKLHKLPLSHHVVRHANGQTEFRKPIKIMPNSSGGHNYYFNDDVSRSSSRGQLPLAHVDAHVQSSHSPQNGLEKLTADQTVQARAHIHQVIRNHSLGGVSARAQASMREYIDRSIERPFSSAAEVQVADNVSYLWWNMMQHQIANLVHLNATQASLFENGLTALTKAS